MSVYVDDMRMLATVGRVRGRWSHMWADTVAELEEMAEKIGLNPKWIQTSNSGITHYDVVESKRREAIAAGAIPLDRRAATAHRIALRARLREEGGIA